MAKRPLATVDIGKLERLGRELLVALGENPNRPGLRETPRRFAKSWQEFVEFDAGNTLTVFDHIAADQMVVISGMRVHSFCEHHLLPFWCDVSIGYIARHKVLGLSKFGRIAQKHAHKLQIQERLIEEIGREVMVILKTPDVAVFARGEHSCMTMRGIKTPAFISSLFLRGAFKRQLKIRDEFMRITRP